MPKGKTPCPIPDCGKFQHSHSKCERCDVHGKTCICPYHTRKRRKCTRSIQGQRRVNWKKLKSPHATHRASDFSMLLPDSGQFYNDASAFPSVDSDNEPGEDWNRSDMATFSKLVIAQNKFTLISGNVVCFPDMILSEAKSVTISAIRSHFSRSFVVC